MGRAEQKRKWLWLGACGLIVAAVVLVLTLIPRSTAVRLNPHRSFRALSVPFKQVHYLSLSRDGDWVVFSAPNDSGRCDVYWMNIAGGEPSRITRGESYVVAGVDVSSEAGLVAYDRRKESFLPSEIRLVPLQGGASRTIADTGYYPRWRPDGKRIGYLRGGPWDIGALSASGKLEIWSVKPDGTDNRLEFLDTVGISRFPVCFCWSPDEASIAWVRNHGYWPTGYGEVMVHELATGRERQLTFDRKWVDGVTWATNDNILFVSTRSGSSNLWVIPSGGGEATQVTQGTVPVLGARISFDNKKLVYRQEGSLWHIWISSLNGRNARQVTFDDIRVVYATFSPDGRQIASVVGGMDQYIPETHIVLMDREGKDRRVLTSGAQIVRSCRWSFDGKWLAYTSRSVEEPPDSDRVYLIQPSNPGAPRLLGKGTLALWLDSENLVLVQGMRTWRYSIKGSTATRADQDSTIAIPLQSANLMWIYDFRKGREGHWIVSIDSSGREMGEARRIPSLEANTYFAVPPDCRFLLYRKPGGNEIWRLWLAGGKQERVGDVPPGLTDWNDVSMDGREILWTDLDKRSKLGLIENLFE